MKTISLKIFVLTALLTGCGGGGGGHTATNATQSTTPGETTETGTAALDVPEGFDFSTSASLSIEVHQPDSGSLNRYLTACLGHAETEKPNYAECLLRTPLTERKFSDVIALPNDTDALQVEVWSLSDARVIESYTWRRGSGALTPIRIGL